MTLVGLGLRVFFRRFNFDLCGIQIKLFVATGTIKKAGFNEKPRFL